MVTVGLQGGGYIEDRCIMRIPRPEIRMVRVYDMVDVANGFLRRVLHASHGTAFLNTFHHGTGFPRVDGFHLVNSLSVTRRPWITTFEHYLPRWNAQSRFGLKLIARNSCHAIIGLSDFAHHSMKLILEDHADLRPAIQPKLRVLHPPQATLVSSYDEKPLDQQTITFTFVGRQFFRKGGMEILHAAETLRDEGFRFVVNIITDFETGDYVTRSTPDDAAKARQQIARLAGTVKFLGEVSNEQVLTLLRTSHVALLPTFDDTYGFSILEAQATGTPVITTDVCVLPEINSDEAGWLIRVPKDTYGQAARKNDEDLTRLSAQIRDGLVRTMRGILQDPASIRPRGIKALERIRTHHDPDRHADTLAALYRNFVPRS